MTLNLQSEPNLVSSQSALLPSMSLIFRVRNYLHFSICGYKQFFLINSWNREPECTHKRGKSLNYSLLPHCIQSQVTRANSSTSVSAQTPIPGCAATSRATHQSLKGTPGKNWPTALQINTSTQN